MRWLQTTPVSDIAMRGWVGLSLGADCPRPAGQLALGFSSRLQPALGAALETQVPSFAKHWGGTASACIAAVRNCQSKVSDRLTAAGQVLRPDDGFRRNLPFVDLRGDRPPYLQQRPLNSDGPDEGPNDSSPPKRSALHDPVHRGLSDRVPAPLSKQAVKPVPLGIDTRAQWTPTGWGLTCTTDGIAKKPATSSRSAADRAAWQSSSAVRARRPRPGNGCPASLAGYTLSQSPNRN
jgi:hypothetical protein